ncbi:hypothetical protein SDC9_112648 [bioreactor metagenome]|uniref:Uncharacterized protein n=1 Tax=bioreactor metagenome TaxID=1076179 RepID=A0A645BK92_9ZZZZ
MQIFSIGIHILTQQSDIFDPLPDQFLNFPDDHVGRAAAFTAAYIRNDTVGAKIIATIHNGDPGFVSFTSGDRNTLCYFPFAVNYVENSFAGRQSLI